MPVLYSRIQEPVPAHFIFVSLFVLPIVMSWIDRSTSQT